MSSVKDIRLAHQGRLKIEWAEAHMPVLMEIKKEFARKKPFKGVTVGFALHVTKETAVLVRTLIAGGAKVAIAGCNPLSTQDDVAAALASEGVDVYAWRGQSNQEYYENIKKVLSHNPQITIDDGGDLVFTVHKERRDLIAKMKGGCEETTTCVIRLRAMEKDNALEYPVIATNDAETKHLFDNHYGTGQSTMDGILRSTNILFSGKTVVVAGYGWCGKGVAMRARGLGSDVVVCEVNPVKALQAVMDGYRVMPMEKASRIGDLFVTTTGNVDVITGAHVKNMKDNAVLCNSGHFNVEINIKDLEKLSKGKKAIRENVEMYTLKNGRRIYLLAEGRLVNLAAAEGHPSEVMDMSFADQALACKYVSENKLKPGVYKVPEEIDHLVARMKLKTMGVDVDSLNPRQKKYLDSWEEGT